MFNNKFRIGVLQHPGYHKGKGGGGGAPEEGVGRKGGRGGAPEGVEDG